MANTNTPRGLQVVRGGGAYGFNDQGTLYSIPLADQVAYYLNDAVKAAASSDTNGVPNVAKCAGTDPIRGSIQGIFPVWPGPSLVGAALALENAYVPATKTAIAYILVDDDPTSIYSIQDDGITTANLVAASANLNSTLTITAGATTTSPSATVLLSSSFAVTNTFNIKLIGLIQSPNNAFGAYAKWQAKINVSEMTGSFVGI